MSRKQLILLFLCNVHPMVMGNGLLPLLPVYSARLGATTVSTGVLLSVTYVALVVGSLAAGWLSSRFQQRRLVCVLSSGITVPIIWLMGHISSPLQLMILTALAWCMGGMGLAALSILGGLFAEKHERGRVFGILAMAQGVGAVLGGLTIGAVADRWGYPGLFLFLAITGIMTPTLSLFLQDKPAVPRRLASDGHRASPFGTPFYLVVLSGGIIGVLSAAGRFGTSVAMDDLHFLSIAITSTAAIAGVLSLILAPLLGRLSDRFNRKLLLALCYVAGTCGLVVLSMSSALWQFWVAVSLLSVQSYAGAGLGAALITDLVPANGMDKALSLFSAVPYIGNILGFAVTGVLINGLGLSAALVLCSALGLAAIGVLGFVRPQPLAAAA